MTQPQQPNPNEQPAFARQPAYGQAPPYGYPPQPRRRTGLILTLAVLGGVGLIITLVLVLAGSGNSPQSVTDTVISAIGNKDTAAARSTLCDPDMSASAFEFASMTSKTTELKATLVKLGDGAEVVTAELSIALSKNGKPYGDAVPMTLTILKKDGTWCVAKPRI